MATITRSRNDSRYLFGEDKRKTLLKRRATVITLYIGAGFSVNQIAEIMNLSVFTISNDISHYFKKPEHSVTLKSKV